MGDEKTQGPKGNTTRPVSDPKAVAYPYRPRPRQAMPATARGRTDEEKTPKPLPTKRPVKLVLEADAYDLLGSHALKRRQSLSALVEELARTHLADEMAPLTGLWTVRRKAKEETPLNLKLLLSTDAYKFLVLTGLRLGIGLSDLVAALIRAHLTEWAPPAKARQKRPAG
jgi:hypothetical protein